MERNKKGQIGMLQPVIITIIIVAVLVIAGFLIMEQLLQQEEFSNTAASGTDTALSVNTTGITLDGASAVGFNSPVLTSAANRTGAYPIVIAGNLSVSSAGVVTNVTATAYTDINITYTYLYGEEGYTALNDTIEAMTTIPDMLGLIILIFIVGIILAIIFNVVPGSRGQSGA